MVQYNVTVSLSLALHSGTVGCFGRLHYHGGVFRRL